MFERLAAIPTVDGREVFLWQHPRLLEPDVAEGFAASLKARSRADRSVLEPALECVWHFRRGYEETSEGFPIGVGPIEQEWRRVAAGEIDAVEGARRVAQPSFLTALSPRYLRALSEFAKGSAESGGWRPAVQLQRLVLAAADALSHSPEFDQLRAFVALGWARVARAALVDVPDPRLLRDAETRGKAVLERLGTRDDEMRARILFSLGALFLDPYTSTRAPGRYEESLQLWFAKQDPDMAETTSDDVPVTPMPAPLEALAVAEAYFRDAAEIESGSFRGHVLKALAQTLEWRQTLGDRIDDDELQRLRTEALAGLTDEGDLLVRLKLLEKQAASGEAVDIAELTPVLESSPEELEREWGTPAAVQLIGSAVTILAAASEPRRALDLVRAARPLIATDDEESRIGLLNVELALLIDTFSPPLPNNKSPERAEELVRARGDHSTWGAVATGAALLNLVARAAASDNEEHGLALLDEVETTSPLIAAEHAAALTLLRANLLIGAAVNALNARDWGRCAECYARAVSEFVEIDLDATALSVLARIGDIVERADCSVALEVVQALAPNASRIEARLGDSATTLIQEILRAVLAAGSSTGTDPKVFHYMWQVAKGARLAPALAHGTAYDPNMDDQAKNLLQSIEEAQAQLSESEKVTSTDATVLIDEEMILTAYARATEPEAGSSPETRSANLQRAYDEYVTTRLLLSASQSGPSAVKFEALKPALGERTVLLSLYLGASADGRIAVYVLYIAGDEIGLTVIPHDFPSSTFEIGGFRINPFGTIVEQIRRGVLDPPLGRRRVSRDTELDLQRYLPGLLGHVSEKLDGFLRAGRDHLCFVPHGPFHYFPFHLLGPPDKPLAADFAVTYLPHLHLLIAGWNHRANATPLAAFGLGFESDPRPGLSPLPSAVAEAREIAAIFGTKAVVDKDVTEPAVVNGLTNARYVHLSTHGRHNVHAPAFQCVYVTPSRGSDGRLFAHEIAGLDLRGVQLLTLSACETALGRFDLGDNLRGLPASFFVAGVTTLVGTLWRVRDEVSRLFFVSLYEKIHAQTPILDSFVFAQRATRDAFPQYRDWGAFYFAGPWAERARPEGVDDDHVAAA